jgi:hypothetical protein
MKMASRFSSLLVVLLMFGCTEDKTYVTQVIGPQDWQGPTVEWASPMDAEVRGTVGLDVTVHDSSSVLRVKLYLDGREDQTLTATPYRFEVLTDSLLDGVHLCEARAWDQYENLGISPVLRVNVANSVAQGPRVLWVPDSFQTIQAAINAATDFDTIRVRDGMYYETLNLFGKGIWIESEHGAMTCTVHGLGLTNVFFVPPSQVPATIRGFTLTEAFFLIFLDDGAQVNMYNNLVVSDYPPDSSNALVRTGSVGGRLLNNLFSGATYGLQLFNFLGNVENNIIRNAWDAGLFNATLSGNPVVHGYDLFWNNGRDYSRFEPGIGDIHADPLLDLANGLVLPGSPAIDAGDPAVQDRDGSRSDIGPFGGPYAY